jgi:protein phosphatase
MRQSGKEPEAPMPIRKEGLTYSKEYILELMSVAKITRHFGKPFLGEFNREKVAFVGDTHGNAAATEAALKKYYDSVDLMVFLGDYVDRGAQGVENLALLLSKLVVDSGKLLMLRGNHELERVNQAYGFEAEVEQKLGMGNYAHFEEFFSLMPYAAVVNGYFCVHGGIAKGLKSLGQIEGLPFPDAKLEDQTAYELLWNDPDDSIEEFGPSRRTARPLSYGKAAVERFLDDNGLKGMIRGHEVVDGFRENMGGKVMTVFSSGQRDTRIGVLLMDHGTLRKEYLERGQGVLG